MDLITVHSRILLLFLAASAIFSVQNCVNGQVNSNNSSGNGSSNASSLGDECTQNSSCSSSVRNAFCTSFWDDQQELTPGFCECDDGYVASIDLERCLFSNVLIGDPCEESQQCVDSKSKRSVCLPGSGVCECAAGYIHSRDLKECLPKMDYLDVPGCEDDAQCQLGNPGKLSHCAVVKKKFSRGQGTEKVCRCKKDAVDGVEEKYKHTCLKKAKKFKDSCKVQAQCTSDLKYSICRNGKCERRPI